MPANISTTNTTTTTGVVGGVLGGVTKTVTPPTTKTIPQLTTGGATTGVNIVNYAKTFIGILPYHLGAGTASFNNLTAADCSSFVQNIYLKFGVKLQRRADAQYKQTKAYAISNPSVKNLQPGDLLFFGGWNTPENPPGYAGIQHVGIYAGNGYVIDEGAAVKNNVGTTKLSNYGSHFLAATRPLATTKNAVDGPQSLADPVASATTALSDPIQKWATNSTDVFTEADSTALVKAIQSATGDANGGTNVTTQSLLLTLEPAVGKTYSDAATQTAITTALTSTGFSKDSAGYILTNYATDSSSTFTTKDFNTFLIASKLAAAGTPVESKMSSIITNLYPMIGKTYNDASFNTAFKASGNDTGLLPKDPLTAIADAVGKLTNPANWLHVGAMILGVGMIGFGVYSGMKNINSDETPSAPSMPIILKEGA
jgi:cell wall-associated NlpC family hydrolase